MSDSNMLTVWSLTEVFNFMFLSLSSIFFFPLLAKIFLESLNTIVCFVSVVMPYAP